MGYKLTWIYVWSQRVRPSWWAPSADTIFYYKFDNNLNDEMGNYDLSVWSGSAAITYLTTAGWAKYAYFSNSCWSWQSAGISEDWDNLHTMSFWMNAQSSWQSILIDIVGDRRIWTRVAWNVRFEWYSSQAYQQNIWTWTWHHIVCIRSGTDGKIYIDWNLEATWTPPDALGNLTTYLVLNNAWDTQQSSLTDDAYLSELILERGEWTAQDVANYYNSTKSNYWIS